MASMKKTQVQGPSGGAGLIRYFDVDEGGLKLSPKFVVGIILVFVIMEIIVGFLSQ